MLDFPDLLEQNNCYKLPSTSPANARFSLGKLIEEWHILKSVKWECYYIPNGPVIVKLNSI